MADDARRAAFLGIPADTAALGAGLTTVVVWGSAFVAIRAAAASLAPGSIALGRLLVSSLVLTSVALLLRTRLPAWRQLVHIALYGVLWLGVYGVFLNASERLIDAGTAAMIVNIGPILIAILAGVFLREGFPPGLFAGSLIAFAGCALIALAGAHALANGSLGIALCLVAVVAYAVAVVVQKPLLKRVSPFQLTWLASVSAMVACLPFAPRLLADARRAPLSALVWVVYLGLFPTALGFATWSFALARSTAGRTAALNFLIPVVAVVLGFILLAEAPPPVALAGGLLSLIGVFVARRR